MSRRNDLDPDATDKVMEELIADRASSPPLQFRLSSIFMLIAAVAVLCALWPVVRTVAPEIYAGAFMLLLATASVLAVLRIR